MSRQGTLERGAMPPKSVGTLESHGSPGAVLSVKCAKPSRESGDGSLPRLATPVCSTVYSSAPIPLHAMSKANRRSGSS